MSHDTTDRRSLLDHVEETLLAVLLGLMTLITFANVVARYLFNSNILWALEATVFLFAWMVLLGAAYCVKINAHLGVDVVATALGPGTRRALTVLAWLCCMGFSLLLLVGAWNYWAPFANLPPVPNLYDDYIAGPLGLPMIGNQWRDQAWYEVNDVPMPEWLRFIEPVFNAGESYTYIPKFIPYFILPLGMALLSLRFLQAGLRIRRGQQDLLIAGHEAEDDIEAAADRIAQGETAAPAAAGEKGEK